MKLIFPNLLAPLLFNIPRTHLLASPDSQIALLPPLQQLAVKSAHFLHSTNTSNLYDDYGPVPGNSPVRYNGDFSTSLFAIETLDMHPNPCVMYVAILFFIHPPCWPPHQPISLITCTTADTSSLLSITVQEPSTPAQCLNHVH
jgi:hypothetical protein